MTASANLFAGIPSALTAEEFSELLSRPNVRIERIVSTGQASPPGFWYDQPEGEWVVLLAGEAGLLLEGEEAPRALKPGDWIDLPAHCRHRVEWTSASPPAIWLAVHYRQG
jgi:cupin 2 domain-containing protein